MRRVLGYVHLETFRLLQLINYSIFQMMAMLQVTPLMVACYAGNSKAAALLLSKGADPNKAARHSSGNVRTPLCYAALYGSTEVCRSLLASGARQDIDIGGEYFVDYTGCP